MRGEDELFFLAESIRQARRLPLSECLQFLRGMLSVMQDDHESTKLLRSIIAQLTSSDAQMELIQLGQLKLKLDAPAPKRRKRI